MCLFASSSSTCKGVNPSQNTGDIRDIPNSQHTHTHMRPADKGRNSNKAMYETHERSTCLGIRNTLFSFTHLDPEPRLHLRAPGLPGHHRATALRRCQRALRAVNGTAPEAGAGGGQWHGAGPLEGPGPDRCVPTW